MPLGAFGSLDSLGGEAVQMVQAMAETYAARECAGEDGEASFRGLTALGK